MNLLKHRNMKKLALTIAIVLGISLCSFAQGGLFQYGNNAQDDKQGSVWFSADQSRGGLFKGLADNLPNLPDHGEDGNTTAPLGGGALLLIGFGAAYAMKKRNEK